MITLTATAKYSQLEKLNQSIQCPPKEPQNISVPTRFSRFAKKARVRSYPLFDDAIKARVAKFGEDLTVEIEKGVEQAFAKEQAKSRRLPKRLIAQGKG